MIKNLQLKRHKFRHPSTHCFNGCVPFERVQRWKSWRNKSTRLLWRGFKARPQNPFFSNNLIVSRLSLSWDEKAETLFSFSPPSLSSPFLSHPPFFPCVCFVVWWFSFCPLFPSLPPLSRSKTTWTWSRTSGARATPERSTNSRWDWSLLTETFWHFDIGLTYCIFNIISCMLHSYLISH